jgi:hypothetical protein
LQSTDPEAFSNLDWTENGKHTKNYGKSQFLMGKSIISMAISIAMFVYQRVSLKLGTPKPSFYLHGFKNIGILVYLPV